MITMFTIKKAGTSTQFSTLAFAILMTTIATGLGITVYGLSHRGVAQTTTSGSVLAQDVWGGKAQSQAFASTSTTYNVSVPAPQAATSGTTSSNLAITTQTSNQAPQAPQAPQSTSSTSKYSVVAEAGNQYYGYNTKWNVIPFANSGQALPNTNLPNIDYLANFYGRNFNTATVSESGTLFQLQNGTWKLITNIDNVNSSFQNVNGHLFELNTNGNIEEYVNQSWQNFGNFQSLKVGMADQITFFNGNYYVIAYGGAWSKNPNYPNGGVFELVGNQWQCVSINQVAYPEALTVYNNNLYVAQNVPNYQNSGQILEYLGNGTWNIVLAQANTATSLAVYNNQLFAATGIGILSFDRSTWTTTTTKTNIIDLDVQDNMLLAGVDGGGVLVYKNGGWQQLGSVALNGGTASLNNPTTSPMV